MEKNEPEWTEEIERELTEIPANGWGVEHIGMKVVLMQPFGTVLPDTIVRVDMGEHAIIGPSIEIGGIIARKDFVLQAMQAYQDWMNSIRESLGDDLI